jgi:hypothetical protein
MRKVTKRKSIFPADDALLKMLYLASQNAMRKRTDRIPRIGGLICVKPEARVRAQNSVQTRLVLYIQLCYLPSHQANAEACEAHVFTNSRWQNYELFFHPSLIVDSVLLIGVLRLQ